MKERKKLQGSDTINRNTHYGCIHSSVWDWQQLFTDERLDVFYLFSWLKHLLEYISVYIYMNSWSHNHIQDTRATE